MLHASIACVGPGGGLLALRLACLLATSTEITDALV